MTAPVSENTIDSRPVRSRCGCTENQTVYCATELCLSVDKLTKEKTTGKERCQWTEVNVHVMYILSTVKTENTHTPAPLEALFKSSQWSPFLSRHHLYRSYHPGFEVQVPLRATVFATIQMFREEICCLRVHSTHRQTFLSYPLLHCQASCFDVFEPAWSPAL